MQTIKCQDTPALCSIAETHNDISGFFEASKSHHITPTWKELQKNLHELDVFCFHKKQGPHLQTKTDMESKANHFFLLVGKTHIIFKGLSI